jgi:sugar lactone lactonase YvrE
LLVADTLRCRIIVYDSNYRFKTEFGYRSLSPEGIVGPMALAVDSKNRLYVSQLRKRGVSVFQLTVQ